MVVIYSFFFFLNYREWRIRFIQSYEVMMMRKRCKIGTCIHTNTHIFTHHEINNQRNKTIILSQCHRVTLGTEFLLI